MTTDPNPLDPRQLERDALKATVAMHTTPTVQEPNPTQPKSASIQRIESLPDHSQIGLVYEGLSLINQIVEMYAMRASARGAVDAMAIFTALNCEMIVMQGFAVDRASQLKATDEDSRESKYKTLLYHDIAGQGDMECALEIVEDMLVDFNRELPTQDQAA